MKITMATLIDRLAGAEIPTHTEARATYSAFREANGSPFACPPLLTAPGDNTKLAKGTMPNYGLTLAPFNLSGVVNLCPFSTKGCRELCLNTSGKGALSSVQRGRLLKTLFMVEHPGAFLELLTYELDKAHERHDGVMGVRLNVLSDVPWERAVPWLFERYPDAAFYDYTKDVKRALGALPANYSLTMSASERMSDDAVAAVLTLGGTVAVVADKVDGAAPSSWNGFPVINGDEDDHRPSDPAGSIVWLKPKGKAVRAPRGGFVRTTEGFAA